LYDGVWLGKNYATLDFLDFSSFFLLYNFIYFFFVAYLLKKEKLKEIKNI